MKRIVPSEWKLTDEQVREIYELEKRLADQLRNANKDERRALYGTLYDEYYRALPLHPHHTISSDNSGRLLFQMSMLDKLLNVGTRFLEIGAGNGSLSRAVAVRVKKVFSLDVTKQFEAKDDPENLEHVTFDGIEIPLPLESIDVVFSDQLIEHLHPEDALIQFNSVMSVLKPGGCYVCVTPNRITGPHDISRFYDNIPRGFHMKEYSSTELIDVFLHSGFSKASAYVCIRGEYRRLPGSLGRMFDFVFGMLPSSFIPGLLRLRVFQIMFSAIVIGRK